MRDNTLIRLSVRLYAALLRLYPEPFRNQYRHEMQVVFRDQCRSAHRRRGKWGVIHLWLRSLPDVIANACGERLTMLRHPKTRNAFLVLALGDLALIGSWILLAWTMLGTVLLLDPWEFNYSTQPAGTLEWSLGYFFNTPVGRYGPAVIVLLLQFRHLFVIGRASGNHGKVVWIFALTNTLCALALIGVIAWGWQFTRMIFPQCFATQSDGSYGWTYGCNVPGILTACLLLLGAFAAQSRLVTSRRVESIPAV